ncbi:MAG: malate synthase A [Pseudomonadota bacterium]|nr:malate synthase A [Pseudomonadota bacterium]
MNHPLPAGVQITLPVPPVAKEILTPEALAFVVELCRRFEPARQELLARRVARQQEFHAGKLPDFLPETAAIRSGDWKVAACPAELQDRRVEITGPTDRKMVVNALNSGAKVFMADFEDSTTPTWENSLTGQVNLKLANQRQIDFTSPEGKAYKLVDKPAILFVRPRGWHLPEKHILIDGQPISGSIFDFALYFFHNARPLLARGSAPYFYLPKMESHLEARLWNDIFNHAQDAFGIARGTIKATCLIETVLGAFEMDEFLYELREHSAGLNAGRWDYIFSCIKKFNRFPDFILADRNHVTMLAPFMRAYALLLVKTCHHRGAFAMGGMAAQIPIKNDPAAHEKALNKVREDKLREVSDGFDGTWVAHPGLVATAQEVFDREMPQPNQIDRQRPDVHTTAADLVRFEPRAPITEAGLRMNINITLQYMGSWIAGVGCVPIFNLMEDAATAEISRAQLWHWIRSPLGVLEDGRKVSLELFRNLLPQELEAVRLEIGEARWAAGDYAAAAAMLDQLTAADDFVEFLTLPAYEAIP